MMNVALGVGRACGQLHESGVPVVVVLPRARVFDDDWLAANQAFHKFDDPSLGTCTVVGCVAHLPGSASGWEGRSAPARGEHTVDVLREVGYDDEQIKALIRSGVIHAADPDR